MRKLSIEAAIVLLVVAVAHPFWLDSRPKNNLKDIFTAAIPLKR